MNSMNDQKSMSFYCWFSDGIELCCTIASKPSNGECAGRSNDNFEYVNHIGNTSSCNEPSTKEQTISFPGEFLSKVPNFVSRSLEFLYLVCKAILAKSSLYSF